MDATTMICNRVQATLKNALSIYWVKVTIPLVLWALMPLPGFSQVFIPGDVHDPIDKLGDSTTLTFYSSVKPSTEDSFDWNDIFFKTSRNGEYARGYNDGPVWKGKGYTFELHSGFMGRKGKFSYSLNPVIFYAINDHFFIPDVQLSFHELGYPYSRKIDWVQRYGDNSVVKLHPGQTEFRYDVGRFVASVGTQNYSVGPSNYNPIILSRQAGGFPHLRLGLKPTFLTSKKNIAKIETNLLFGMLKESDYFDDDSDNDNRYFNGLFVAVSPAALPDLTIGFNKVLYKQSRYFQGRDLISTLFIIDTGVVDGDTLSPNDSFDQLASLSIEWKFPENGFRAYAEFAKNDFTSAGAGLRPTAVEPEHSRGYTIGFEKILKTKKGADLIITYEHTNLSVGHAPWRPTPSFYAHTVNRQGYTHDGQILGAGIGPGGNSDHLGFRLKKADLSILFLLQRIERDRDYFVRNIRNSNAHDIEYSITGGAQWRYDRFDLFVEGVLSHNYSRNYGSEDLTNIGYAVGGRLRL